MGRSIAQRFKQEQCGEQDGGQYLAGFILAKCSREIYTLFPCPNS